MGRGAQRRQEGGCQGDKPASAMFPSSLILPASLTEPGKTASGREQAEAGKVAGVSHTSMLVVATRAARAAGSPAEMFNSTDNSLTACFS